MSSAFARALVGLVCMLEVVVEVGRGAGLVVVVEEAGKVGLVPGVLGLKLKLVSTSVLTLVFVVSAEVLGGSLVAVGLVPGMILKVALLLVPKSVLTVVLVGTEVFGMSFVLVVVVVVELKDESGRVVEVGRKIEVGGAVNGTGHPNGWDLPG